MSRSRKKVGAIKSEVGPSGKKSAKTRNNRKFRCAAKVRKQDIDNLIESEDARVQNDKRYQREVDRWDWHDFVSYYDEHRCERKWQWFMK